MRDSPPDPVPAPDGHGVLVPIGDGGGGDCWLVRAPDRRRFIAVDLDGELVVLDGLCPHAEAPMARARVDGGELVCTLHWWRFDARTGEGLTDPGQPLAVHPVVMLDGVPHVRVPHPPEQPPSP